MQTIENQTLLIDAISTEKTVTSESGNYDAVRYNAMKHGFFPN
jgi:hypothetical protein